MYGEDLRVSCACQAGNLFLIIMNYKKCSMSLGQTKRTSSCGIQLFKIIQTVFEAPFYNLYLQNNLLLHYHSLIFLSGCFI